MPGEIPVARALFKLEDRLVSLDTLHTQDETARALVLEHGADYLLTVKGNQPIVSKQIETLVAAPQGDFPHSRADAHQGVRAPSNAYVTIPVVNERSLHLRTHYSRRARRPARDPDPGRGADEVVEREAFVEQAGCSADYSR